MAVAEERLLVGRDDELAAIDAFLDHGSRGPVALCLEGAAGIGKSTLWLAGCRRSGRRKLSCRPAEAEQGMAYAALGDLLHDVEEPVLAGLPPLQRSALDAALLRGQGPEVGLDGHAVAAAFLGVLRTLSSQAPLLVAIDDVQWLDSSSARVLEFALRRVDEDEPVAVLVTRRPDAKTELRVDRLQVGAVRPVGPVDLDTLDEIIQRHLQRRFLLPMLVQLHRVSEGNPFLALEIARAIERSGRPLVPGEPLPVPGDVRELVEDRLSSLPVAAREVVDVVAQLAAPTARLVRAVVGEDVADPGIDAAVTAGVLEHRDGTLSFTHPLLAATARAVLAPRRAARLHRSIAAAVTDVEQRARHLALATSDVDTAVVAALDDAARVANTRGAPAAAAELLELAIARTPPDAPRDTVRRRILDAALAQRSIGNVQRARELLEIGIEAALEPDEAAEFLEHLPGLVFLLDGPSAGVAAYEAALEASADAAARATILSDFAWVLTTCGRVSEGLERAETALSLAGTSGEPKPLCEALGVLAAVSFLAGEGRRPELIERARELVTANPGLQLAMVPEFVEITQRTWSDEFDEARMLLDSFDAQLEAAGEQDVRAVLFWFRTIIDLRQGRWESARRNLDIGDRWSSLTGMGDDGPGIWLRALVLAYTGDARDARDVAEKGANLLDGSDVAFADACRAALGFLALAEGDAQRAWSHFAPLPGRARAMGFGDPGFLRWLADAAEAALGAGEAVAANDIVGWLSSGSKKNGNAWGLAAAARCTALIAAAEGDGRAGALMGEAVRLHERLDQPFELARTLLVAGAYHRRQKRKAEARKALERARAIFAALPAAAWVQRVDDELARLGGRPSSPGALTATEARIAELVARGLTNREVADALFVSTKTVEWNLSKIYRKLDVRSRSELTARWTGHAAEPQAT